MADPIIVYLCLLDRVCDLAMEVRHHMRHGMANRRTERRIHAALETLNAIDPPPVCIDVHTCMGLLLCDWAAIRRLQHDRAAADALTMVYRIAAEDQQLVVDALEQLQRACATLP